MKKHIIAQIFFFMFVVSGYVYAYLYKENMITSMRIAIAKEKDEIYQLKEDNLRLSYQVDLFENPKFLFSLAKRPEYSHLEMPFSSDILVLETEVSKEIVVQPEEKPVFSFYPTVVVGAKH